MGLEASCEVAFGGKRAKGKAHLEPLALDFRGGELSLTIPLERIRKADAKAGVLSVVWAEGAARFILGPAAETWASKLRYPKSRLDKLGVKPGMKIGVLGLADAEFLSELRERGAVLQMGRLPKQAGLVFLYMDRAEDLPKLTKAKAALLESGAIWVIWPKGRKAFREDEVRAYGPSAGLVDVKVVAFSDTLSALKLVIPLRDRR